MEKKNLMEKLKKFNIIDVIAVVIIALVALVVLWKAVDKIIPDDLFSKDPGMVSGSASTSGAPTSSAPASSTSTPGTPAPVTPAPSTSTPGTPTPVTPAPSEEVKEPVHVTYVLRAENIAAGVYEQVKEHIPSQLMMSGVLYDAQVVGVEKEPALVLTADGKWVEDPSRVTLLFTVEGTVPNTEVMTTLVATQEVRIGDPGYDLVTEYMEFIDTTVVDVEWKDWDFGASRQETSEEDLKAKGLVPVTFVVRAENRAAELYENAKEYIPSRLMAGGALQNGWIVGVEKEPVQVLTADGKWVEDPDHVTLLFTVKAYVSDTEVKTTRVGTQEVRIGRTSYILKSEYLEFRNTIVVDVDWEA